MSKDTENHNTQLYCCNCSVHRSRHGHLRKKDQLIQQLPIALYCTIQYRQIIHRPNHFMSITKYCSLLKIIASVYRTDCTTHALTCWSNCKDSWNVPFPKLVNVTIVSRGAFTADKVLILKTLRLFNQFIIHVWEYAHLQLEELCSSALKTI